MAKNPFCLPHLLLYPCFTVSCLLPAASLSSKGSFKSSDFRLQIHNAKALTAPPSSKCSSPFSSCRFRKTNPPNVQVLSVAAVSEKPKAGYLTQGEFFTVSMYLFVLFLIFPFYLSFNLAMPRLHNWRAHHQELQQRHLAIRLARWIWRKVHPDNNT